MESNQTNFELIFIEFFEYFLPFQINGIANFRIESNEFRMNSNLTPPLEHSASIATKMRFSPGCWCQWPLKSQSECTEEVADDEAVR